MRIQNSPTPTLARSSPESLASSKAAEGPRERFESFSQDDQGEIRETLRQLNRKGRLYRQSENGGLRKIESLEAYRSLSIGGPGLYDAIAIDILTSSQSSKLDQELYRDHFSGFQTHQFEESDSQIKSAVQYQATPIESFAELLWTDLAPEGPKGCAYLSSKASASR